MERPCVCFIIISQTLQNPLCRSLLVLIHRIFFLFQSKQTLYPDFGIACQFLRAAVVSHVFDDRTRGMERLCGSWRHHKIGTLFLVNRARNNFSVIRTSHSDCSQMSHETCTFEDVRGISFTARPETICFNLNFNVLIIQIAVNLSHFIPQQL